MSRRAELLSRRAGREPPTPRAEEPEEAWGQGPSRARGFPSPSSPARPDFLRLTNPQIRTEVPGRQRAHFMRGAPGRARTLF